MIDESNKRGLIFLPRTVRKLYREKKEKIRKVVFRFFGLVKLRNTTY